MSRLRGSGRTNETSNVDETANDDHTRQLRLTTHMDKVYKEFFKVYLTECEKTRELIKQENERTRSLLKELITTIKDTSSQTRISQLETSTMIINKLDACHYDSMKLVKETLSQMNRSEFREDITGAKKLIDRAWNEKYKSRNDLFWRHHRNKRLEKKEIMQNLRKEKVRAKLQLQKIRYERQLEFVKEIDNAMTRLIESSLNDKIARILPEQWTKQCQTGELRSKQEFSKKEQ